jgi:hypothetical protein
MIFFYNNSEIHTFGPQEEWTKFGRDESRISWRETKKVQIKLVSICNKNEQQQDADNNAEL